MDSDNVTDNTDVLVTDSVGGLENSSEVDIQSNVSTINTEQKNSLSSLHSDNANENANDINEKSSDNHEEAENETEKNEEAENETEKNGFPEKTEVINESGDQSVFIEETQEEVPEPTPVKKIPQPKRDECLVCQKTVYPLEKRVLYTKMYHKSCVRCKKCNKMLEPSNTSKMGTVFFCTTHYKEEFLKKGKYEVGSDEPVEVDYSSNIGTRDVSSSNNYEAAPPVTHAEKFKKYKELMDQSSGPTQGERKQPIQSGVNNNCSVRDMMRKYENPGNDATDGGTVGTTSDRAELKNIRANLTEMKRKFESQEDDE